MSFLVIGYGNELRGDDGVGPAVARAVEGWEGVTAVASHGLTPEMAEPISAADGVAFVDASVGGEGVGVVELEPGAVPGLGHASDPRWLLELAERVFGRRPRAWLVTVPAAELGMGAAISEAAARGMEDTLGVVGLLAEGGGPCTRSG